jgi:hypothetical protein
MKMAEKWPVAMKFVAAISGTVKIAVSTPR